MQKEEQGAFPHCPMHSPYPDGSDPPTTYGVGVFDPGKGFRIRLLKRTNGLSTP